MMPVPVLSRLHRPLTDGVYRTEKSDSVEHILTCAGSRQGLQTVGGIVTRDAGGGKNLTDFLKCLG